MSELQLDRELRRRYDPAMLGLPSSPVKPTPSAGNKRRSSSSGSSSSHRGDDGGGPGAAKRRRHAGHVVAPPGSTPEGTKANMFDHYQPWVIQTYGDQAKTKTITLRKHARILRTLRGEESNSVENSKFRFWVKAKGFCIGRPPGYVAKPADGIVGTQSLNGRRDDPPLYVPTAPGKDSGCKEKLQYKKVAVVENFFDIIYTVHVEMEGRAGKHAGQKRTYRTITETYAFLPREAVTRFLLGCTDCQRRPRSPSPSPSPAPTPTPTPPSTSPAAPPPPPPLNHSTPLRDCSSTSSSCSGGRDLGPCPPVRDLGTPARDLGPAVRDLGVSVRDLGPSVRDLGAPSRDLGPPSRDLGTPVRDTNQPVRDLGATGRDLGASVRDLGASVRDLGAPARDLGAPARDMCPVVRDLALAGRDLVPPAPLLLQPHAGGILHPLLLFRSPLHHHPLHLNHRPQHNIINNNNNNKGDRDEDDEADGDDEEDEDQKEEDPGRRIFHRDPPDIDFSLPITTTYLKHMRSLGYTDEDALKIDVDENVSTPEPDLNDDDHFPGRNGELRLSADRDISGDDVAGVWAGYHSALGLKKSTPPGPREQSSPLMLSDRSLAHETSSVHDETSSSGNKEDEDDDDDDAEDKIDPQQYDPERLKAFNMFVRLFVDENLDRIVPISKQPKEKIQAIIDSCARQFPEFAERARKRIRTYLKSCRRNKRSRDTNGAWDATRPTPAHLTSVQAEQILAQACENESHNAKRMRLGLEPVSQPMPLLPSAITTDSRPSPMDHHSSPLSFDVTPKPVVSASINSLVKTEPADPPAAFGPGLAAGKRSPVEATAAKSVGTAVTSVNGNITSSSAAPTALYRPNFTQAFQRAGPYPSPLFPTPPFGTPGIMTNGPTDLSMKTKPLLSHKLNTAEMAAVRQLITGYRESAAFLLRSADELEQLLLQQQ
ncbi:uncharacterized protein LOC134533097 [Bacillus rossius redtenbacheri]|uniref:uncharacterized protein LOC134533097 n=1 Tax=Bacillus rossius redtenbacheri TaxID=93214 RepID=UPI002FDEF12D